MSRKFNPYAYVDKALNDTMLGQAVGWDTATGWMNVVERRGRRPMAAGGANQLRVGHRLERLHQIQKDLRIVLTISSCLFGVEADSPRGTHSSHD